MLKEVDLVVDGDQLRQLLDNPGYDIRGRRINIDRAQAIAAYNYMYGSNRVAVALVAPYRDQREDFKKGHNVLEFYLHYHDENRGKDHFHVDDYEPPQDDFIDLNTSALTPEQCINAIKIAVKEREVQWSDQEPFS